MEYNLEERTINFSKQIIDFCKKLNKDEINKPIINQLIRSATSIGANYCEANGASSKSDFRNKIHICKKEAQETRYWLKLIEGLCFDDQENKKVNLFIKESHELVLIFGKIAGSSK
jgi:four helix bundle protein